MRLVINSLLIFTLLCAWRIGAYESFTVYVGVGSGFEPDVVTASVGDTITFVFVTGVTIPLTLIDA